MASTKSFSSDSDPVVLIDGGCVLCNRVARFVMRHDSSGRIRFAALDSPAAEAMLANRGLPPPPAGTFVYLDEDGAFYRSEGALRLAARLDAPWRLLGVFRIVPRWLRDAAYGLIARWRYRFAGRVENCALLSPLERERFL